MARRTAGRTAATTTRQTLRISAGAEREAQHYHERGPRAPPEVSEGLPHIAPTAISVSPELR